MKFSSDKNKMLVQGRKGETLFLVFAGEKKVIIVDGDKLE